MSQTESTNPNPVQKSLGPMVTTWTRCISWTVLLSLLLAVLFAMALDGCAAVQNRHAALAGENAAAVHDAGAR